MNRHPEELDVSDYAMAEIALIHKIKLEINKSEMRKLDMEMSRYG